MSKALEPVPQYSAAPFLPDRISLSSMREAVQSCRGCPLYRDATQAVFGEGRRRARVVLVGEQPGNEEDLQGHPFVGPSGQLLNQVLESAGIDRDDLYVTNAVKHFKWEPRGKRRLHAKPTAREVGACRDWLEHELLLLKPEVIVCMGATAALGVFKRATPVLANRGRWIESEYCAQTTITVHPSSVLRAPGHDERERAKQEMIRDFEFVARALSHARRAHSASFATAAEFSRRMNHS